MGADGGIEAVESAGVRTEAATRADTAHDAPADGGDTAARRPHTEPLRDVHAGAFFCDGSERGLTSGAICGPGFVDTVDTRCCSLP